jgi:6-phosphogluconolactonase (cycloisomerase 2 family)
VRRGRTIAAGAVIGACVLASVGVAGPTRSGLNYKGCVTGNTEAVPACDAIDTASLSGGASGLNGAESVTVGPDSRWVYAMARQDDSIARFKRDRGTGQLTYKSCLTGDQNVGACASIPSATAGGGASGLDDVRALVVSPDGNFAYAVVAGDQDDALAAFERSRRSGQLDYRGCLTGSTQSGSGGTGACDQVGSATSFGAQSGFDHPKSLTLSPDGKSLYLASTFDAAIARFKVDRDTGEPIYKGCITGEEETGASGTGACTDIPDSAPGGSGSGLTDVRSLNVSRDGKWLYGVAADDDSVVRFARDTHSGALTYKGCLSGDSNTACSLTSTASTGGVDSGLDGIRTLALSPSGRQAYVATRDDAAVVRFARSPRTGKLTFKGCISGDVNTGSAGSGACKAIDSATALFAGIDSGLGAPESVVVPRDGSRVYVSLAQDSGVAIFKRARSGKLKYNGCITGQTGVPHCSEIADATPSGGGSGLGFPQFMALSPDRRSLYAAVGDDDAVATFRLP